MSHDPISNSQYGNERRLYVKTYLAMCTILEIVAVVFASLLLIIYSNFISAYIATGAIVITPFLASSDLALGFVLFNAAVSICVNTVLVFREAFDDPAEALMDYLLGIMLSIGGPLVTLSVLILALIHNSDNK